MKRKRRAVSVPLSTFARDRSGAKNSTVIEWNSQMAKSKLYPIWSLLRREVHRSRTPLERTDVPAGGTFLFFSQLRCVFAQCHTGFLGQMSDNPLSFAAPAAF